MRLLIGLIVLLDSSVAFARAGTSLLPKGVGLYQFGYRYINEMQQKYDENGTSISLGENFDREFSGRQIITGRQGKELQKLGTVLKEYEGGSSAPGTLAGDLYLGHMKGDVRANVSTQILGLGFGILDQLTVFAGIPYIKANVRAKLTVSGPNNAQETLDKLGEAAFPDLRDGLVEASQLSAEKIKSNFAEMGYQPVDSWSHQDVGDLRIGARTGFEEAIGGGRAVVSTYTFRVDVPTGYVEKPDILTDINFGRGYYTLNVSSEQIVNIDNYHVGVDALYAYSLATRLDKRVPEGEETTMTRERTASVTLNPGEDSELGFLFGGNWDWVNTRYRMAWSRHFNDRYSGSLSGNYETLADGSDTWKLYHEISLSLDTARAYRAGEFGFPFVVTAKAHQSIEGHNTPKQTYYELTLASFFTFLSSK